MQAHYSTLIYKIELCFHGDNFAKETNKNGHSNKNIGYGTKIQEVIEEKIHCQFITTYPGKKNLVLLKLSMKYLIKSNN